MLMIPNKHAKRQRRRPCNPAAADEPQQPAAAYEPQPLELARPRRPPHLPPVPPPRILLVRFGSIGDVLLTTPLLRALREQHRDAFIAYLTKSVHVPLVADNPRLDEVIALAPGDSIRSVAERIRSAGFDHRLDLHGSIRTRALRALVPGGWTGYPKHRVARTVLIRSKRDVYRDRRPVAERYFDAARGLGVEPDGRPPEFFLADTAVAAADSWLLSAGLSSDRPLVALAPGAAHATKRWPADRWQALARLLGERGFGVALVGGPGDREAADAIAAASAGAASAAGRTTLQETGAIIRRAAALVSGDTGVMHMATGVGTAVVALFGPTVRQFGFVPYSERSRIVELPLGCRPCHAMGGPVCPLGHHLCLRGIAPEPVLDAVMEIAE
jgi:lipopolysaccharide heptosyltransferase II